MRLLAFGLTLAALAGCSSGQADSAKINESRATRAAPPSNLLRMKIDGVEWQADHDIWGTSVVPGSAHAVLISGSKGPKDANEQTFNINLYSVNGPGTYPIVKDNPQASVVQLANLSPQRFLAGGLVLNQNLVVELVRVQSSPVSIEAHFHGTLSANDDSILQIEDGEFRYSE